MKEKTKFTATLLPLNVSNVNGRMYVNNDNLRDSIEDLNKRVETLGVVYGEYNHKDVFDTSLSRCSHTIKNIRIEDDKVVGDITILNTHWGKELEEAYKDLGLGGICFGPRCMGIMQDGVVFIKKLFTFDVNDNYVDLFIDEEKLKKTSKIDNLMKMDTKDKNTNILKLLELNGGNASTEKSVSDIIEAIKHLVPDFNPDRVDMKDILNEIHKELIPIYDKYFTNEEILGIIEFYKTPIGKSYLTKMGGVALESMQVGNKYGEIIYKKLTES